MKLGTILLALLPLTAVAADFTPSELVIDLKVIANNEDNIMEDLAIWMAVYDRADAKADAKALALKYIQEDIRQLTEVYAGLKSIKVISDTKSTRGLSYAK